MNRTTMLPRVVTQLVIAYINPIERYIYYRYTGDSDLRCPYVEDQKQLDYAANICWLDAVRFTALSNNVDGYRAMYNMTYYGNLEMVKYLASKVKHIPSHLGELMSAAIPHCHMLEYYNAYKPTPKQYNQALAQAASVSAVICMEWLYQHASWEMKHHYKWKYFQPFIDAIVGKRVEVMSWIASKQTFHEWQRRSAIVAANDLTTMRWFAFQPHYKTLIDHKTLDDLVTRDKPEALAFFLNYASGYYEGGLAVRLERLKCLEVLLDKSTNRHWTLNQWLWHAHNPVTKAWIHEKSALYNLA